MFVPYFFIYVFFDPPLIIYSQSRNMAQITALEAEVAKVQKALDSAKATYSSLQRQYQEQCCV